MYIGRNASMTEGFVGCVSRVEFDDIYPLKLLFQQDGPPNVSGMNSKLYYILLIYFILLEVPKLLKFKTTIIN